MRAILSVYDKRGLVPFAQGLQGLGYELFSTGGTFRSLAEAGVSVKSVEEMTGFPEILEGRVKTLHPAVHGGILARRDLPSHMSQLREKGIQPIDLVAVNLYPFRETVAKPSVALEEALENIDIGGPTMIRAAAKNFPQVVVVVDPEDYTPVLEGLRRGNLDLATRRRLAQKAFQHVASYDTLVAQYLRQAEAGFPEALTIAMEKLYDLRYGENPHQEAAFYGEEVAGRKGPWGIAAAQQLGGKELSYNNILDADAAWRVVSDFAEPTIAIIKHNNPCGLASHSNLVEAYRRALAGDPVSAFGGIVAANHPLDLATAQEIGETFYEIVIAPGYQGEALEHLRRKRDLRLLLLEPKQAQGAKLQIRHVEGGFLVQTPDRLPEGQLSLRTVTRREATAVELDDLLFAWKVVRHIKSNAIVLAKDKAMLGMGAGQPNRVVSVELALKRAGEQARGSVLASDAFFPFPDSIELAASGGVTAAIQPGGSIRDKEAIEAADRHGMAMLFTGERHFLH